MKKLILISTVAAIISLLWLSCDKMKEEIATPLSATGSLSVDVSTGIGKISCDHVYCSTSGNSFVISGSNSLNGDIVSMVIGGITTGTYTVSNSGNSGYTTLTIAKTLDSKAFSSEVSSTGQLVITSVSTTEVKGIFQANDLQDDNNSKVNANAGNFIAKRM